jgi:hypothetical protein
VVQTGRLYRGFPYSYEQMIGDGCEIIGELKKLGIDASGCVSRERRQSLL